MGRSRFAAGSLPSGLIAAVGLTGILLAVDMAWRFGGPREAVTIALAGTSAVRHLAVVDWLLVGWFAVAAIGIVTALLAHIRAATIREGGEIDLAGDLVLVVDSNRERRRETLRALENLGAAGLEAVDDADATELMEAEPPDVVLILESPGVDAAIFERLIGAREGEPPPGLVILSARRETPMITRLPNGFDPIEITRAVFDTAERRRSARAATPPIVDFDLVRSVVGGSEEDAIDMLRMFTRSVEESVESLSTGDGDDFEPTREAAHRICGAARTAGVERLARALASLEHAALNRDRRGVEDARRAVASEFAVFKRALARRADEKTIGESHLADQTGGA